MGVLIPGHGWFLLQVEHGQVEAGCMNDRKTPKGGGIYIDFTRHISKNDLNFEVSKLRM